MTFASKVKETKVALEVLGVDHRIKLLESRPVAIGGGGGSSSGAASNTFGTIAISGQSNVVADSSTDTLTLAAGSNITLTTNATTDTVTIAASSASSMIIQEVDGSPTGTPTTLKVTNGALTDNGDGSFTLNTSGAGSSPGGATGNIQFNNAGSFGGGNNLHWLDASNRLSVGAGVSPSGTVHALAMSAGPTFLTSVSTVVVATSLAPNDASISGSLKGWYKADAEAYADNDPVGTITDQSGGSRNLTQAAAGSKPIFKTAILNSQPVYRFDGTDDIVASTAVMSDFIANNAYTVFVVGSAVSIGTNGASTYNNDAFVADSKGYFGFNLKSVGTFHVYNWDGSDDKTTNTLSTNAFHIIQGRHESGNIISQIDADAENSVASGNTADLTGTFRAGIGLSNSFANVDIAEIIVYNTALTGLQRAGISKYLVDKYALTGNTNATQLDNLYEWRASNGTTVVGSIDPSGNLTQVTGNHTITAGNSTITAGNLTLGSTISLSKVAVTSTGTTTRNLVLRQIAAQTADYVQGTNSADTVNWGVTKDGWGYFGLAVPTASKVLSVGGLSQFEDNITIRRGDNAGFTITGTGGAGDSWVFQTNDATTYGRPWMQLSSPSSAVDAGIQLGTLVATSGVTSQNGRPIVFETRRWTGSASTGEGMGLRGIRTSDSAGDYYLAVQAGTVTSWAGVGQTTTAKFNKAGKFQILAGLSTSFASAGGTIFGHISDSTVGGAETDIYTNTLPANTLGTNADRVEATYGGNFVTGGTELTQLKAYFAGTAIWDSTALAPSTGTTSWRVFVEIVRVSSTVVRYTVSLNTTGATGYVYAACGELTGLTLSGTNDIKITGTSSGVGSGAGDIVGKMGLVRWNSA